MNPATWEDDQKEKLDELVSTIEEKWMAFKELLVGEHSNDLEARSKAQQELRPHIRSSMNS